MISYFEGSTYTSSEASMFRKVFDSKKNEVSEQFIIVHNEELYDRFWSSNIVRLVKSRSLNGLGM
jgi:hypothetical protein